MKKIIIFLILGLFVLSCEPEETPAPPTPPVAEPPAPTEPEQGPMNIFEVSPSKNDIGDTITIKGENFTRNLSVLLHNTGVTPILLNDSIIKFSIPFAYFDPFDFNLKLKNKKEEKVLHNPFELYAPVIDSIPGQLAFNDRVVLYGKHLTNQAYKNNGILYLDDHDIQVVSHSPDSIVFDLPWQLGKFQYDVLVKAQLQEVKFDQGLVIRPPSFESFSKPSVEIGEVITIHGSNFYPHRPDQHEVSFEGNRAEVVEAFRDSLKVRVPMGPYKSRKIDELKIKLFEEVNTFDVDLDIASTWYMYGYKRDGEITGGMASVGTITRWSFSANGAFYFNVFRNNGNYSPINNVLYKYTPETDHWEEIDLPIPAELMEFGEVLEFYPQKGTNKVFIYIQRDTDNFFSFNLETKELVQLKNFPTDGALYYGTGFHFNGNFYYGLGYFQDSGMVINKLFWRYDPASDTWNEIGKMPDVHESYPRAAASIFHTGNSVIIANGHEQAYDVWEFSSNETWSRKNDVFNPAPDGMHVQKGQTGYFYNYFYGDFWEYDIPADQWSRRDDLKIKGYDTGHEIMFIHGDYMYYVGYLLDYGPDGTPYFRYDHAILRTELSNF